MAWWIWLIIVVAVILVLLVLASLIRINMIFGKNKKNTIDKIRFCPKCHNQIWESSSICPKCGKKLK